jgi:hypothetical protein
MKTPIRIISLALILGFLSFLTSCEKEELAEVATGKLELSINVAGSQLKSDYPDSTGTNHYSIIMTVINSLGEVVMDGEMIQLYRFGDEFISEKIEMKAGRYQLSEFMIINPDGKVVFASPLEGSPKAYLAKNPLPMSFDILPDQSTKLVPEVLEVRDGSPSDFGYASFGFNVIKPLPFYIMAVFDDPMLMAPIVPVEAKLSVHSPDGWSHEFFLEARVNRIEIRGGSRYYALVVEKEGHIPQKLEIPAEKLFNTSREYPLIIRFTRMEYKVLTLQPGPENGKDAMITNLEPGANFGEHPYFESTFISEPLLAVMRSTQSLIHFNPVGLPKDARIEKVKLTLHYDTSFPWDSIYDDSIYYFTDPNNIGPAGSSFAWFGAVLQQVVEPWAENEVTWSGQPETIEANQVYISPFIKNANFIDIDVTSLFVPVQEIAAPNYGMMLKLWPSEQFSGFRFASSDYREPEMRPRLQIFYTMPNY